MNIGKLLPLVLLAAGAPSVAHGELLALRVGKAETIANGTVEHAVILIEDGKIVEVGEDLILERGIPVLNRPDWVVTPGLVNCYSRAGMDSRAGSAFTPDAMASGELFPSDDIYQELLEDGVTTLGLYPAGSGVAGQAVVVRPYGDTKDEMIVADNAYLKVVLQSTPASKKMLRKGFEAADKHDEKVQSEREKWEKKNKKKKSKKKKDDDEDEDEDDDKKKKKDDDDDGFVPPEPDAKTKVFIDLREQTLAALMRISKAGDYLHLMEVLSDEDIDFSIRVPLRDDIDLYEVKEKLGEHELSVVLDARLTLQPATRRDRNIPAELAEAGARVALVPTRDSATGHDNWMNEVGYLIANGMDRQKALAAITLEPARVLGLEERLGSLEAGKDANLVIWTGDPFEPSTQVHGVMLEGEFVYGDIDR